MKALLVLLTLVTASLARAQGSGAPAAGSAAPAADAGSASAASDPSAPTALSAAPPAIDLAQAQATCDAALANPPGGDKRFINEVQYAARGWLASEQLTKSNEGRACMATIANVDTARSKYSDAADAKDAAERVEATRAQHEKAAAAIAKNEKHVVLAYAALWILSAGFLLFLWGRQQTLKREIAQLKRDLDAAAKE